MLPTPDQRLRALLSDLFSLPEIARFLKDGPQGDEVELDLPPHQSMTMNGYLDDVIPFLRRRGLLDGDLFDRLRAARPRRVDDIDQASHAFTGSGDAEWTQGTDGESEAGTGTGAAYSERRELGRDLVHQLNVVGVQAGSPVALQQIQPGVAHKFNAILTRLEALESSLASGDGGHHLAMAEALAIRRDWRRSAQHYDAAARQAQLTWSQHFSRGVAHANRREGALADLAALRAYFDASAVFPADGPSSWRSRLFIYRGAMLKRLMRLEEAEFDVRLGRQLATTSYDRNDAEYNLACIYALRGDRESMLACVIRMDQTSRKDIKSHLNDYFVRFQEDRDLLRLL